MSLPNFSVTIHSLLNQAELYVYTMFFITSNSSRLESFSNMYNPSISYFGFISEKYDKT